MRNSTMFRQKIAALCLLDLTAVCAPAMASTQITYDPSIKPLAEAIAKAQPQVDAAASAKNKGEALAQALREAGILSAMVSVQANGDLVVALAKPVFTGDYADYFTASDYLTKRQLEAGAVKASNRGKADGKSIKINVGQPSWETGTVQVVATSADVQDWKNWAAGVGVNNYGSRYSGSDLATAYARVALEDGNEVSGSFAHGFSNSTPDSYGGRYNAASVAWAHHGAHGTTRTEFTNALWTAGGPVRIFDLTGRITTFSVGHWVPLSAKWTVFGQVLRTENRQHLGVVGWKDQTNYTSARIGAERTTPNSRTTTTLEKGLGGSRDFNAVPLLGTFDPHYTALRVDWEGKKPFGDDGWMLRGAAGGHVSTSDTPSNEQFSAGGPGRGRAWLTGTTSGQRGAYGEVIVEAPSRNGLTPYAGLDTAIIDPQVGNSQRLSSAFIGTRYTRKNFNLDAGYAHGVGANELSGQQKDSRIFLSAGFNW
jgi:hemolysin activation/secretion protein